MLQTFYECISNRFQTRCERFTNNVIPTHETPQNTPPGVGADSSCPYPNITKMHIPITQNAYSHNQIRISPPHYVCVYVYADTINRPLQLLTAANYVANTLQNTQRTPTKWGANTPLGVGADSSCPYPNIINYTCSHYQIRVYSLSNMHIHITKYAYSSPISCVFSYMRTR